MRVRKESAPISKRQLLDRMKQSKELNKTREIVCSYSKFQCNLGSTVCCKSLWDIFSEGCLEQLPTIEWAVKEHNADIRVITFFTSTGIQIRIRRNLINVEVEVDGEVRSCSRTGPFTENANLSVTEPPWINTVGSPERNLDDSIIETYIANKIHKGCFQYCFSSATLGDFQFSNDYGNFALWDK